MDFHWNHRVVRLDDEDKTHIFAEVFYDKDDKPIGFTEPFMSSDSLEGLHGLLSRLIEALNEPVLDSKHIGEDHATPDPQATH